MTENVINAETNLIALLGHPVAHSLSPLIHNTALEHANVNARYLAFSVRPSNLGRAVEGLRVLGALGANVTLPHKRNVAVHAEQLTDVARATGAVNTLVFSKSTSGRTVVHGHNTDVSGFASALVPYADVLSGGACLVLGAGGAARAVVYALANNLSCGSIVVASRDRKRAHDLIGQFGGLGIPVDVVPYDHAPGMVGRFSLVVNATPVGMWPDVGASPVPDGSCVAGQIVYDLVYAPMETALLLSAKRAGATTISGVQMLISQAAASFKRWTGVDMPIEPVQLAVQRQLEKVQPGPGYA